MCPGWLRVCMPVDRAESLVGTAAGTWLGGACCHSLTRFLETQGTPVDTVALACRHTPADTIAEEMTEVTTALWTVDFLLLSGSVSTVTSAQLTSSYLSQVDGPVYEIVDSHFGLQLIVK